MVKAMDLRIGNVVAVGYDTEPLPDTVIVLEPGLVYLANREHGEQEWDIAGVGITAERLLKMGFKQKSVGTLTLKTANTRFILAIEPEFCSLYAFGRCFPVQFIHQVQNHVYYFSGGHEIIPFKDRPAFPAI